MRDWFALCLVGLLTIASVSGYNASLVAQDTADWEIGPNVRGRNYSVGMPLRPIPSKGGRWSFEFPYPNPGAGHVHAVTYDPGPLTGASKIVMRYRIDAARHAKFAPQETPDQPATVSVYFQRVGDSWSGKRKYEFYRWYAPAHTVKVVSPGEHEIEISLSDPNWISVHGRSVATNPAAFQAAIAQAGSVGVAFGSSGRRAHGIFSTGPARFTLLEFRII